MKKEKIWIHEKVKGSYMDVWDFGGMIDDVIGGLQADKALAEEAGYRNIGINLDWYGENIDIDLTGERLETDGELNRRIKKAQQARERAKKEKKKKEEQEHKLYLKLQKKYEK